MDYLLHILILINIYIILVVSLDLKRLEAVPALIQAMQDEDSLVRRHAAWALGQIATPESLAALQMRLEVESESEVKRGIEEAMAAGCFALFHWRDSRFQIIFQVRRDLRHLPLFIHTGMLGPA